MIGQKLKPGLHRQQHDVCQDCVNKRKNSDGNSGADVGRIVQPAQQAVKAEQRT